MIGRCAGANCGELARIPTDWTPGYQGLPVKTWVCSVACLADWEEQQRAALARWKEEGK